ncbi:carboxypeptidase-like regulatory domain-containing protein [Bizionia gelidisalsuginis]|uniref:Carboxypeptidase-like regulatory domain-containing protein n=1 Tax=Bizionia gelidisalsuginis TaxID=291188 RepID=A0ABY3MAU5_9FLAO|nr:carboxypeptidase-like regulatory domain-containing protein [Bizionia gelidisalsuginis]TYC12907.1 carboxypeptidase-like regulatory domain-containing protein [Bizionia gelidisalsuginis]
MIRSLINITNLKKQLFCFFLFVPALLISQTNIDGNIKDTNNTPINGANIILKKTDTDEIATFTTSNAKGYFNLQTETGNYTLKISALGFETIIKNIELKNTTLSLNNITLIENSTALEEVIINAENNGVVQKGDVTQYKIEKFLNGTEESLKDVITRLPGLDINENGKITANGKEIDRLLIDGENLYKKQHQLATENINSEMVKNAELIRNYKDFESISTNDKTGITALNINIKEEFKNKFTGNFETHLGFKDKYKVNASLFNFNKRVKFSLIPSSNNLGESTMSIHDYYALTDTDVRSNLNNESKVTFSKLEDLPRFLNSNNNVAAKSNNFVTISSIANLSDKIKLDFYGIFNTAEQEENYSRELLFKSPQNLDEINENNKIIEKNYFAVLQLKSIYKPNKNSVLTLNNYINIDNTTQDKDIENLTNEKYINTKETNKPKKINFNSEINYSKNINSNTFTSSLDMQTKSAV